MQRLVVLAVLMALIAQPACAAKRVTVAQLEQALASASAANKPDAEIARQIGGVELSERLTQATMERLTGRLAAGSQAVLALKLLADQSAFLDPPASELPVDPMPDPVAEERMLGQARNYVAQTLPHLPNLLATQTTDRYDDSAQESQKGQWPVRAGMHLVDSSSRDMSVLNEQSYESRTSDSTVWHSHGGMISGGEFGSTLGMILADTVHGKLAWSHWEQAATGRAAVFRYSVPKSASHFEIESTFQRQAGLEGVATPMGNSRVSGIEAKPSNGSSNISTVISRPGYHGSLWLDPATGSILGLTVETGSKDGAPFPLAAILVQYGPVEIGDSEFICPVRSVALSTADAGANLDPLTRLPTAAPTRWLNESTFTNYHRFGATTRVVANGGDSSPKAGDGGVQQAEVPQTGAVKPNEPAPAAGGSGKTPDQPAPVVPPRDVTSSTASAAAAPTVSTTAASAPAVSAPVVSPPTVSAAPPQNEPQPIEHAIKVNVNRVLVPVVVRDKNGLSIGGLTKEDFQIFDDGKPRSISNFTVEKRAPAKMVEKSPQLAYATSPATQASAIPSRIIVFLFDDLHLTLEDLARVQKAGIGALEALSDSDMAAVVTISGTNSGLTRDHQKLHDAIMKVKPVGLYHASSSDCPSVDYYQANLIENQHDITATAAAINQVFSCDPALDRQRDQDLAARLVATTATRVVGTGRQGVQVTLSTVREIVRSMAAMPGERTIVLVSPGFLTIEPDALIAESQIIDLAAQSSVTISALDARGLYTTSIGASEQVTGGPRVVQFQSEMKRGSMSSDENPLSEFANGTGGIFFHNSSDLDAGFQHLTETPEYVYLLEFSIDDLKPDGYYHRLKVRLDREGMQLWARQGYFVPKP
jgi:VWFA-related protein